MFLTRPLCDTCWVASLLFARLLLLYTHLQYDGCSWRSMTCLPKAPDFTSVFCFFFCFVGVHIATESALVLCVTSSFPYTCMFGFDVQSILFGSLHSVCRSSLFDVFTFSPYFCDFEVFELSYCWYFIVFFWPISALVFLFFQNLAFSKENWKISFTWFNRRYMYRLVLSVHVPTCIVSFVFQKKLVHVFMYI